MACRSRRGLFGASADAGDSSSIKKQHSLSLLLIKSSDVDLQQHLRSYISQGLQASSRAPSPARSVSPFFIMSTQYDKIGARYKSMSDLPAQAPEKPSVLKVLGDVKGLNCLDLACGLGRWSHVLLEQGAAHVTGIDISEGMIKSAQESLHGLSDEDKVKVDFQVGDCGKVFAASGGPFDLVLAVWFLNYASCYKEMLAMWQNVHANLKPGGRFVALTSNAFIALDGPFDDRYGINITTLEKTEEGGWKCRVTGYTQPEPVEFENYHMPREIYERSAAEAGMQQLTWRSHTLPDDGRPEGYWDVYDLRPHYCLLTAVKPQ